LREERGLPWQGLCPIQIASIPSDGRAVEEEYSIEGPDGIEHWGQLFLPKAPVRVRALLRRVDRRILAEFDVEAELEVPCARCLALASVSLREKGEAVFLLGGEEPEEGEEGDPSASGEEDEDEQIRLDPLAQTADLGPRIHETLLLALPATVLCREDCAGICPVCGGDRNRVRCDCVADDGDPRLAGMRTLWEASGGTSEKGGK